MKSRIKQIAAMTMSLSLVACGGSSENLGELTDDVVVAYARVLEATLFSLGTAGGKPASEARAQLRTLDFASYIDEECVGEQLEELSDDDRSAVAASVEEILNHEGGPKSLLKIVGGGTLSEEGEDVLDDAEDCVDQSRFLADMKKLDSGS